MALETVKYKHLASSGLSTSINIPETITVRFSNDPTIVAIVIGNKSKPEEASIASTKESKKGFLPDVRSAYITQST
jgi:hypothetical protein